MEWVETTGRSVEAAKEAALDQLGVDEHDAEFQILEEAKVGLFGRIRSEARVRARVRPTTPRPKEDRRDRRRRSRTDRHRSDGEPSRGREAANADDDEPPAASTAPAASATPDSPADDQPPSGRSGSDASPRGGSEGAQPAQRSRRRSTTTHAKRDEPATPAHPSTEEETTSMDVPLEEQAQVAKQFLDGLVHEMGLTASISVSQPADDVVELEVNGGDLGVLIGSKGATLAALQELTRTVAQRRTSAGNGRLMVDVAGYRRKRAEALARFAQQLARQALADGTRTALEPMPAADRKVVHDALTGIDGVVTSSEGEEPNRRVVIIPDSATTTTS